MAETTTAAESRAAEQVTAQAPITAPARAPVAREEPTRWVGWVMFASVMLIISGVLQFTAGLIAAFNDQWAVWGNQGALLVDFTAWGWAHMAWGVVAVLAGVGLLSGNIVARTIGVIVAALSIWANFLFMPAYPIWSIVVITVDLLVMYAITAHGRELRPPDDTIDLRERLG